MIAARNPEAQITAVEIHEHRARALKERVAGMNVKVVTGNATAIEWRKSSIARWWTCHAAARERWRAIRRSSGG